MKIEKFNLSLCFLSILTITTFTHQAHSATTPDLYSQVDDVIRINSTTFIPVVFQQNKNITYMVQFYNTFCGHCQMFAPIYKELGTRVKNWTSVFRLAAIDCSKDENIITCSENKIEGYPTVYIYPPNAKLQDPNDAPINLRSLNISWTVDGLEEGIVDYIANLTTTRDQYPLVVEALKPITTSDSKQLKRIYPLGRGHDELVQDHYSSQDLMFIVESESSYLGRRLIIEYFRIHTKLELRRILVSNRKLLKILLTEDDFKTLDDNLPVLIKLNQLPKDDYTGKRAQVLVKGEEKHVLPTSEQSERSDFIYNRFKMFFEHYYSTELENEFNSSDEFSSLNWNNKKPKVPATSNNEIKTQSDSEELDIQNLLQSDAKIKRRVFAIDLLKSISYMITHEVKIKGDLSPAEFNTVRNTLTLLKKYLPLEKWDSSVFKFIDELRTRLDANRYLYEVNGIKAQEMRDLLDLAGAETIRLRYNRENWVSCLESDKHQKGYTCSLWLLFHTLTVGEYSKAAPVRTRPTMVLFTMRDYITNFLGCTVCSSNYAKETENLDASINGRNSSVLWLWNTHNRINQRLNNEKSQQDKKNLGDIIFPNRNNCPLCIKSALDIGVDGKTLDDINWDMESVFNYMIDTYKPERVITPVDMAALLAKFKGNLNYDLFTAGGNHQSTGKLLTTAGADMNRSVEEWNIQSIFSTSDISLCLFLYLTCIMIVAIVCVALNPKWRHSKIKK